MRRSYLWVMAAFLFVLLAVSSFHGIDIGRTALAANHQRAPSALSARSHVFKHPDGVALDTHGNVYVADSGLESVVELSPQGTVFHTWGSKGAGPGQFDGAVDVTVDRHGTIYVSDLYNNRVQKLSSAGKVLATWGITLRHLTLDTHGNIWGTGGTLDVVELSPAGKQLAAWSVPKPQRTGTNEGIAVDSHGTVYIADEYFNRIYEFTPKGKLVRTWGKNGQNLGQLDAPEGATVDRAGNLYVADSGNNRIQKFSPNGKALASYGDFTIMLLPQGVAVDSKGNVFVATPNGIEKFSARGKHLAHWS